VYATQYIGTHPSQDKLGEVRQEGHQEYKWWDDRAGGTDSPDGVASSWIVGASASVIFPCSIKV